MTILEYLKVGGLFTFPKSKATKTAELILARDLRRNLVSNSTKGYIKKARVPNRIKKGLSGLKFNGFEILLSNVLTPLQGNNFNISNMPIGISANEDDNIFINYKSADDIMTEIKERQLPVLQPTEDYSKYVGFEGFNKAYNEVELEMPEARLYRNLLTKIAKLESAFKMNAKNPGAAAYGYFLFMQDGNKYNNIKLYSGLSIEEFTKNPKALIKAAIKLALSFQKSFKKEDLDKALRMGISMTGLIGGAWLGGPGGVRKVLNGTGNPSDRHWNNGLGSDVGTYIQMFNNL